MICIIACDPNFQWTEQFIFNEITSILSTHLSSAQRTHRILRRGTSGECNGCWRTSRPTNIIDSRSRRQPYANIRWFYFLFHVTQSICRGILFELCAYLLPDACLSFVSNENARFHTFLVRFSINWTIAAIIILIWAINNNCVRCVVLTRVIIVSNVFYNCFALANGTRRRRSR